MVNRNKRCKEALPEFNYQRNKNKIWKTLRYQKKYNKLKNNNKLDKSHNNYRGDLASKIKDRTKIKNNELNNIKPINYNNLIKIEIIKYDKINDKNELNKNNELNDWRPT